ncbi:1-acyl-sn-glycerol-3-phosphate acyltransferase [Mesorhizobium sp. CAU 1741]|uniref:1-acyl-sn-glycerol-3-phosphate acyltransferase n=1 Tax=Mesorhizobium sp. CAU 1741 TaxID=3140366 RepID=UPI00325AB0A5
MILIALVVGGLVAALLIYVWWISAKQHVSFQQALLLSPLALIRGVDAKVLRGAANEKRIIYVVAHQSRLDAALMLSLLPDETLHILDDYSANAGWLEPWRSLARTIPFKAEHVFVSRRLVRVLRGGGRLCVYMPPDAEPDTRAFRLYRAVARIALRAEARVMPIHVAGTGSGWSGKLSIRALKPATIEELVARSSEAETRSGALYRRVVETREDEAKAA